MKKIAAVVVTYNRFELVKKTIAALHSQTHTLNEIFVINNGSTDRTKEWLDKQTGLTVIHQENTGGSGGFWRGIMEASVKGYDWLWCMDDDVFPREDCLANMLDVAETDSNIGIVCPHRIMNNKTFTGESKTVNLTNPFKNSFCNGLSAEEVENNTIVDIQGMAFEGPLIKSEVVQKIGLPNKELFILYDDTDYSYRAILAGYRVVVSRDSLMDKHYFQSTMSYTEDKVKNKWKLAYHIRNSAYFCHEYGKNIFVRYLGAFRFLMTMYAAITFNFIKGHKYSFSDYFLFAKMIKRGITGELGKM